MSLRYLFLMMLLLVSCRNYSENNDARPRRSKEEMADLNRYLVSKDRERIESYIERKELRMSESPTGLWFFIDKQGEGDNFSDGDKVIFNYDCSLLDGTECYSSDELGPKEVILGRSPLEAGLNEGFRLLKPGAEATFILPPYMAFGLVGDGKKIPSRSILVYKVAILRAE